MLKLDVTCYVDRSDVDDTLYPINSGLSVEITKNIEEYMVQKLGIEESKVPELCFSLYKNYGTTLAGLAAIGYEIDYEDFHSYVHGRLPYHKMLKPNLVLKSILHSLPVRKVIFTNADKAHAIRVISRLGLEDCFEGIICFETLNPTHNTSSSAELKATGSSTKIHTEIFDISSFRPGAGSELPKSLVICKPFKEAFEEAFRIANINPHKTLFLDDSVRNIETGKTVGLGTVLVGTSCRTKGADQALESIHNIKEALPELWEANEKAERVTYPGKVPIETTVIA
ncbi:hypothetical protein HS088_TW07G00165 [Tripterygium wilfordii]|uniref:Uncharacterized protein n=1 Tax=Tripterygium wilfordii TaxID=458696 RepID=A0A7J7DE02_TRIWF|nr:hypothetical protein HS088_TW07G00165 [Tripterygium wilfordii]